MPLPRKIATHLVLLLLAVGIFSPPAARLALAQEQPSTAQTQPQPQAGQPQAGQPQAGQAQQPAQQGKLADGLLDRAASDIDKARKQLASLQEAAQKSVNDDDALVVLSGKADDLNRSIAGISASLKPRFDEINNRLTQIGAPPKEGQPPEVPLVAQERDRLTAERSQISVVTGDIETVMGGANRFAADVTSMRRELFAETLLRRTELSGTTFGDAAMSLGQEMTGFRDSLVSWGTFVWKFKRIPFFTAVFLSLGAALVLLSGAHRLFGRYFQRDDTIEAPPYISRLSIAFWSTMVDTLCVAALLVLSYLFLSTFNVLRPDIAPVLSAFFGFTGLVYFVNRVTNAVFAPAEPRWRLVKLSNRGARSLSWCLQAMAIVNGLDFVLNRISEAMGAPVVVTVAKSFVAALIVGAILIAASFGKPILAKNGDPEAPGRHWPHGMAIILRVIGGGLIFTAMVGYVGLSRFIASQLIVTSAVLVTMYLGVLLGKAVSSQDTFPETKAGFFLKQRFNLGEVALDQAALIAGMGIYFVALFTGIPLILMSWGFHIQDLELFAYRLFTEIHLGNIRISLVGIGVGVLLFAGGLLVTRWFQRWLDNNIMARSQVDTGVRNSVKTGIGYLGVTVAAVIAISAAGIDLSSFALVASALSVGIGFGLQNIVSNFVSGLILLVERPFKVGDWIVSGTSEGIVKRISVRATEIETFRKQSIIVPNSELINASVGNWTHRNRLARSEIPISVSYDSDPQKVMDVLLELVQKIPKVLRNPEPHVEFVRFGPSSLDFEMRFYLADLSDGMPIRNNLRIAILERFRREGIEMPAPTQEVHIRREPKKKLGEAIGEPNMVIEAVEPAKSEEPSALEMKPPQELRSRTVRRRGEG